MKKIIFFIVLLTTTIFFTNCEKDSLYVGMYETHSIKVTNVTEYYRWFDIVDPSTHKSLVGGGYQLGPISKSPYNSKEFPALFEVQDRKLQVFGQYYIVYTMEQPHPDGGWFPTDKIVMEGRLDSIDYLLISNK
jgi:hypothetical protein